MGNSSAAGFAAAVIVVGTLAASATSYNAVSGFSAAQTGPWSYLGALGGAAPSPLTSIYNNCQGDPGVTCVTNGQAVPNNISVDDNASGAPVSFGTPQVSPNFLNLDPESGSVTVRWTAPAAGPYDITGSFIGDDTNEQPHDIAIFDSQSAVPLLAPTTLAGYGTGTSFSFDDVPLALGDYVDFMTYLTGTYTNLSTGFNATITGVADPSAGGQPPVTVPEPGTLLLVGTALIGIGLARWRSHGI